MKINFAHGLATLCLLISLSFLGACASNNGPSDGGDQEPDPIASTNNSVDLFINQVDAACQPSGNTKLSAFISVIDQDNNLVDGLNLSNFKVTNDGTVIESGNLTFSSVQDIVPDPISVVIIMDYSISITEKPAIQTAMENAVLAFIDLMGSEDQVEIIKFNTGIRYTLPFTSDKEVLRDAVTNAAVDTGATYLHDTLYYGIEDVATQTGRLAVIAITDGRESHEWDEPGDGRTVEDVIELGQEKSVPLFLIGLDTGEPLNVQELTRMAEETSGHFYQAATSDDLNNIYTSISDLLTEGQYLIEFEIIPGAQAIVPLEVSVTYNDLTDSANTTYTYPDCP